MCSDAQSITLTCNNKDTYINVCILEIAKSMSRKRECVQKHRIALPTDTMCLIH